MADQKISELTELTAAPASNDYFVVLDSDVNTTKKVQSKYLLGVPTAWTPTIEYTGGSGTPTISAEGRYMTIGKTVFLLLTGKLTRNGATHAYLSITTPTSIEKFGSGSFTHQFGADSFSLGAVYKSGGSSAFNVSTGTWTTDGYYWFSGFYEMP